METPFRNSRLNALSGETSPYLLQHADNPVDWHPWGPEALELARKEKKPILLSIGYSACHWCHVMAHESFEDEETAAVMNQRFVNIKVDREERPDLDKIYQTAQQLLTGRTGGWPLTMFLDCENHVPFFGGTYFPPSPRHGLPGFKDLLLDVSQAYQEQRPRLAKQNATFVKAMNRTQETAPPAGALPANTDLVQACVSDLAMLYDEREGGFGRAPKFPHPVNLELLLEFHCVAGAAGGSSSRVARRMATFTIEKMAQGGIYDHLGGGFCRYAVDALWRIPHFEKMLYDNGPLLALCANAARLSGEARFARAAQETAAWALREMQAPEGGFFSSIDADSEGEEGKFYTWTPEQARALLSADEYACFAPRFGLDQPANFEGKWHLYRAQSVAQTAQVAAHPPAEVERLLHSAAGKLFAAREERIRPGRDEKILTSWNAMMIKGLSVAALRLGQTDCQVAAERCLRFVHDRLWDGERLAATYKDGQARLNAYLDDYAFLIDAIVYALSCRWSGAWLRFAMALADKLLERFFDSKKGGFFFTSHDHEALLQRRKDFVDDSLPSGNGVAAAALFRLGHLTGRQHYLDAAEQTLKAGLGSMERMPQACDAMLLALLEYAAPRTTVILRGQEAVITDWQRQLQQRPDIRSLIFAIPDTAQGLPELLAEKNTKLPAVAFVCQGFQCLAPVSDLEALQTLLASQANGKPPEAGSDARGVGRV